MSNTKTFIKAVLVFMVLLSGTSYSQFQIPKTVIGTGGGAIFQTTGNYVLSHTVGQSIVGLRPMPPDSNSYLSQGFWFGLSPITSVENPSDSEIRKTISNFPNPVNNNTTFTYKLDAPGRVTLKIYDITGQEIVTLVDEVQGQGEQKVDWDVKGSNGLLTPSGTYLYELNVTNSGNSQTNLNLRNILVISR